MPPLVISVPTLNDGPADFDRLFEIWQQVNDYGVAAEFNFAGCGFLRPNAVAVLGGIARLAQSRAGTVIFNWDTMPGSVRANLCQNGFARAFGYPCESWAGHSIPFREDRAQDMNGIMDYLTDTWLGRGWVHVSQRLRDAIVGRMWEMYSNAFEHAGSQIGVFSCGQHFRNKNELVLSVADFGQGIAANVRNFLRPDPRADQLSAAGCLRWAFQRGTSTRSHGTARGLGLDLLKEFIRLNHGKLEVYSNEGYGMIDETGESFSSRATSFEGTVFHITLRCDEKFYMFADEAKGGVPF